LLFSASVAQQSEVDVFDQISLFKYIFVCLSTQ